MDRVATNFHPETGQCCCVLPRVARQRRRIFQSPNNSPTAKPGCVGIWCGRSIVDINFIPSQGLAEGCDGIESNWAPKLLPTIRSADRR